MFVAMPQIENGKQQTRQIEEVPVLRTLFLRCFPAGEIPLISVFPFFVGRSNCLLNATVLPFSFLMTSQEVGNRLSVIVDADVL